MAGGQRGLGLRPLRRPMGRAAFNCVSWWVAEGGWPGDAFDCPMERLGRVWLLAASHVVDGWRAGGPWLLTAASGGGGVRHSGWPLVLGFVGGSGQEVCGCRRLLSAVARECAGSGHWWRGLLVAVGKRSVAASSILNCSCGRGLDRGRLHCGWLVPFGWLRPLRPCGLCGGYFPCSTLRPPPFLSKLG